MSDPDLLRRAVALEAAARQPGAERGGGTTWAPAFVGSGGGGSFSYSTQLGVYVRSNDVVSAWFALAISPFTSAPGGDLWITGLPFTSNAALPPGAGSIAYASSHFSAAIRMWVPNNATRIECYDTSGAIIPASVLANNAILYGMVVYRV